MHDDSAYQPSNDSVDVLLVEDNPGDVRLTREALDAANGAVSLETIADGDEAVASLKRAPANSVPDLVLLDLNLPGRDGCAVLEAIRSDPRLEPLPVIMLTSSDADEDIVRCYEASANAYLTKPTDHAEFVSLLESLERFWLTHAKLPPDPA